MKTAFVICSRLESSRVPRKALAKINGIPLLGHLIDRLKKTDIDIILAVPDTKQYAEYVSALADHLDGVLFHIGQPDCPLGRTAEAASVHGIDNVIRVCHDKIFIDPDQVFKMLDVFNRRALDYVYSSRFVDGSAFEVISKQALVKAAQSYSNVEFIGYAVRAVTENVLDLDLETFNTDARLLLDYPADKVLLETVMASLGNDCSLADVVAWLEKNPWAKKINALPKVTLYTCAFNAEKFINRCMGSIAKQDRFREFEYIIVDDHSTDRTTQLVSKFCSQFKNSRWIRNDRNVGLASSSNVALKQARGRYIMRLDADDYLPAAYSVSEMLAEIEATGKDVIIPNNYFGSMNKIQHGKESMHIGGTIFRTRAVNHVKFTDGLRGYEGLDFFTRARDQLDIGYLNKPMFFYTQRGDSMSKTNLEEREKLRQEILRKP